MFEGARGSAGASPVSGAGRLNQGADALPDGGFAELSATD